MTLFKIILFERSCNVNGSLVPKKNILFSGNGLIDENDFMQWVTKIQALQGLDVTTSGGDSEEEITRDLLAAFK